MMTGLCTLALTASCDDSNKKKIAEQQATIDSLQRVQEAYRQQAAEKAEAEAAEAEEEVLDTAELKGLSEIPAEREAAPAEAFVDVEEPTEGAPVRGNSNQHEVIVYCCSSDGFVNIRQRPDGQSPILGKLTAGGRGALVLDSSGKWWKVRDNNTVGYVHSSYITTDLNRSKAVASRLSGQNKQTSQAKSDKYYYVVIGSYSTLAEAKRVRLEADIFAGSPVYKTMVNGKAVYRICPFEFTTKSKAEQYVRDIKNSFWTDAWVWSTSERPQVVYKFPGLK